MRASTPPTNVTPVAVKLLCDISRSRTLKSRFRIHSINWVGKIALKITVERESCDPQWREK